MSQPPYHLRTNKAVERLLFVEMLRKLDGHLPTKIERYAYVGLGGPFLEDFALMHGMFGMLDLKSLETERHVRTRQEINLPCSRIKLTLDSTTVFVRDYVARRKPQIIWFDYEWPDWKKQLSECSDLIRNITPMSILKITLSGRTKHLPIGSTRDPLALHAEWFNDMFANYGPFTPDMMRESKICRTLFGILKRVIADTIPDTKEKCVRTLASYEYNDRTPILTVTLIVGPREDVKEAISKSELNQWPFSGLLWREPKKIDVPDLSLRERLAVNKLLPGITPESVLKRLKLTLSGTPRESLDRMKSYVEFYRHVPQFLRFTL
jgi:hypothetical protein